MRIRCMRVLAWLFNGAGTISDFFEGVEMYWLSRAFHKVYNGLDNLHWALYRMGQR